jgi:hypothetical protein
MRSLEHEDHLDDDPDDQKLLCELKAERKRLKNMLGWKA